MVLHRFTVLANVQGLAAPVREGREKKVSAGSTLAQSQLELLVDQLSSARKGPEGQELNDFHIHRHTQPPLFGVCINWVDGLDGVDGARDAWGPASKSKGVQRKQTTHRVTVANVLCKLRKWDGRVWGKSCWRLIWEMHRKELGRTRSVVLYSSSPSRSGSGSKYRSMAA